MTQRITRRRFVQAGAAAGAISFYSGRLTGQEKKPSANERLAVGMIGVAGQAGGDLNAIAAGGAEIVALCDVDEKRTGSARERFKDAKFYTDFRKLVEQKGLDAIGVGTPDHTHAVAAMAGLKNNLHVFCEKPLTHKVQEARLLAEEAAKRKRVTQMGTQIHAGANYRRVVELIQSGAIGPVKEVHVWCGKSWGGGTRPKELPPVPEGLHWDLWLGGAPERPYHPAYVPFNWRKWWDFGGGTLADMACHYMDLPFWALELRHPTRVEAKGPPADAETAAVKLRVDYDFPERGKLPAVKLSWYDGGDKPAQLTGNPVTKWDGDGVLFVGDKGMLISGYGNHKLLPEEKFTDFKAPQPTIPNSIGHYKEWVEACKSGGPTTCNFDYSGALTEAVLLGNVAYRLGKAIEWDSKNLKATNAPEAEKFIVASYRKGWSL